MKWSETDYRNLVLETQAKLVQEDSLDNVASVAEDLLCKTPGLGKFIRKGGFLDATSKLALDIINANDKGNNL